MKSYRVIFAPSFKEFTGEENKTLLDVAREAGVYIDSVCGGKGKCGKCKARVEGMAGPVTREESQLIKQSDRDLGYRLTCMTRIAGDVTVFVPGETIFKSDTAKKGFSKRSKTINPAVKSYVIDLSKNKNPHHSSFQNIINFLSADFGLKKLVSHPALPQNMAKIIEEGNNKITVFVRMDREIMAIRPGENVPSLGLALDIGTTTVALYLCDLKNGEVIAGGSFTNPQVLFGADIMSRIAYSANHPEEGTKRMQKELISAVNAMIDEMAAANGFSSQDIVDMTVVGNTVMHHIFLGYAPDRLGLWPFTPSIQGSRDVKSEELGIRINPCAYIHVLPVEAGFVGADNVGVLLSEEPHNQDELSLIIDLGTNGELVLGNRGSLLSCSCATGPAFEGAHISSGMRATAGAIEKVRIDPDTLSLDYAVVGTDGWASEHPPGKLKPLGLCGSGIIDTIAHLFKTGIIKTNGTFSDTIKTQRLRKAPSGVMEFVLAWKDETGTGSDVVLTQKDVRQLQLAKAALHSGCKVLMDRFGIKTINRMIIAGAFGMHIDKENALTIGLFPWCRPENITMAGNAAGHGAYLALMDREKRAEADRIAVTVKHVELALEDEFQREFINALSLPEKPV